MLGANGIRFGVTELWGVVTNQLLADYMELEAPNEHCHQDG